MILFIVWADGERRRTGYVAALESSEDRVDVLFVGEDRWATYRGRMKRLEVLEHDENPLGKTKA